MTTNIKLYLISVGMTNYGYDYIYEALLCRRIVMTNYSYD